MKYLNNVLEGDHGRLKRILGPKGACKNRTSAYRTLKGDGSDALDSRKGRASCSPMDSRIRTRSSSIGYSRLLKHPGASTTDVLRRSSSALVQLCNSAVHRGGCGRQQASIRTGGAGGSVDWVDQPQQVALAGQRVDPDPGWAALVLGPAVEQGVDLRVDVLDAPASGVAGHIDVQDEHRGVLRVGHVHVLAAGQRAGAHPVQLRAGLPGLRVSDPGGGESLPGQPCSMPRPRWASSERASSLFHPRERNTSSGLRSNRSVAGVHRACRRSRLKSWVKLSLRIRGLRVSGSPTSWNWCGFLHFQRSLRSLTRLWKSPLDGAVMMAIRFRVRG